jgi:hypothetical protein
LFGDDDVNIELSLADWMYMLTIITILVTLAMRKDALIPSVIGLITIGTIIKGNIFEGLVVGFNAISAATIDLLSIIMTIAFVVMMNKVMEEAGTYRVLIAPLRKFLSNPFIAYWVIGITCVLLALCIRSTSAVLLIGTLLVPVAIVSGMPRIVAGMILAIYGKGIALSGDFITQGTANMTAKATNLPIMVVFEGIVPVWAVTSLVAAFITTIIAYKVIRKRRGEDSDCEEMQEKARAAFSDVKASKIGKIMAVIMPLSYIGDILIMLNYKIFQGNNAIALIGGTTLLLAVVTAIFHYKTDAFNKLVEFSRQGWAFAFTVFGPVVIIAGLFWLGGDHIKTITGNPNLQGLTYDWGYWLAGHIPLSVAAVTAICMLASALAAFDGSGFAAIPLGATLAVSLGTAIGANVPYLVAGAVMAAIWTGATLVPWGFLAVSAAMAGVDAQELSRRNMIPCGLGLLGAYLTVVYLA